jgi:hypothetical protein
VKRRAVGFWVVYGRQDAGERMNPCTNFCTNECVLRVFGVWRRVGNPNKHWGFLLGGTQQNPFLILGVWLKNCRWLINEQVKVLENPYNL